MPLLKKSNFEVLTLAIALCKANIKVSQCLALLHQALGQSTLFNQRKRKSQRKGKSQGKAKTGKEFLRKKQKPGRFVFFFCINRKILGCVVLSGKQTSKSPLSRSFPSKSSHLLPFYILKEIIH